MALLDERAELRLRTPFNIFVGGSILDRGITIPYLIAFYYGRNPRTMQADTVLQHSRMYGNRDRRDLAVTRFYTSRDVYDRLYTINEFENTLRGAFESGAHEQGVVFIQADAANRVRPCAPNKVLVSNVVAVRPAGMYLPTGFQTRRARAGGGRTGPQYAHPEQRARQAKVHRDRPGHSAAHHRHSGKDSGILRQRIRVGRHARPARLLFRRARRWRRQGVVAGGDGQKAVARKIG
jgi:hypothetical protein